MGLVRVIRNAVLGPLFLYFLLLGHVVYQVAFKTSDVPKVPVWPPNTNEADKQKIIAARNVIIGDLMDASAAKNKDFVKKHASKDIECEDPLERFVGYQEVSNFFDLLQRLVKDCQFTIQQEQHSPHGIHMDWTHKCWMRFLPNYPITMSMRTHILLESSSSGKEKVFKIYDEWNGNALLNEKTVCPSILGKVHTKLRRFSGYLIGKAVQNGII